MSKTATVRARIEPNLKEEVETLFHKLGLTTTDAINIFFKQVKLRHGLPFEVAIPNDVTKKVMDDSDNGKSLVHYNNTDEMFTDLGL